ncbi:MAG: IS701 family transposase [Anaerolineae bacterium]|nr:IS701 family transposase [Anaerolineae bacterium]
MDSLALDTPTHRTPCQRSPVPAKRPGVRCGPAAAILVGLARRLHIFHARFHDFFVVRTRDVNDQSKKYLLGLVQSEKRNMERMAEVVPDSDDQVQQHFMTNSPWSHRAVLDQIAQDMDAEFCGSEDYCLIVDESALGKKGKDSVGVARQWNGRLGKVDNCQVGVFVALGCGDEVTLTDERLFLPQAWIDNPGRCNKAKIPVENQVFRSKSQLALDMVRDARRRGLQFRWVGLDGGYGKEPWLLRALDRDHEQWVADVHCDQRVYLEDPQPIIPVRGHGKGRPTSQRVAQTQPVRVDRWAAQQPATAWKKVAFRESTKATLVVEVLHRRVWLWDGKEAEAHCWHLLARREIDSPKEIKYSLSNAPETTPTERLTFMQGQRYWVEHSLRNAKSEAGMGHYQLRLWQGWHHHMAMVMLAMLFHFETRRAHKQDLPLLSCHDVGEVLRVLLPRANTTYEDVVHQVETRHKRRQASIDSAYAKQHRTQLHSGP